MTKVNSNKSLLCRIVEILLLVPYKMQRILGDFKREKDHVNIIFYLGTIFTIGSLFSLYTTGTLEK
jgi:hypothetical protein